MAARLKEDFGIESQLDKGSGGVFDVTVDGDLIFSKHEHDRFPTNDEIVDLIRAREG